MVDKKGIIKYFFDYDKREREIGDDLGIYFYAFMWFFFGVTSMFAQNAQLEYLQDFYINFEIFCVGFLVIYFWRTKNKKIDFPNASDEKKWIFLKVFFGFCFALVMTVLLGVVFSTFIPGQLLSDELLYLGFEFFRLIPIEEILFRGLGIELFMLLEERLTRDINPDPITIKDCLRKNIYFLVGGIINSVLFGFLHFRAYPSKLYPLIYLVILGLFASWLRFKFGLGAAIGLHAANNAIALAWAMLLFV